MYIKGNNLSFAYDRWFRLSAAANHNTVWGHIDQTLWSLTFSWKAKASRCKHCFSISYQSTECTWAPEHPTSTTQPMPLFPQRCPSPVCFKRNSTPRWCPVIGCAYDHICLYCVSNPTVLDKLHKGIHCPNTIPAPWLEDNLQAILRTSVLPFIGFCG